MKQWETRGLNWVLLSFCATLHHNQHISCNTLVFKSLPMLCAIAIVTERTHKRNRLQYSIEGTGAPSPQLSWRVQPWHLRHWIILPLRNNSITGIHFYSVINFYPSDVWSFLSCGNQDVADGTTASTGYKSPLLRSVTEAGFKNTWRYFALELIAQGLTMEDS